MTDAINVLNTFVSFQEISFPALLRSLLEEHQKSRSELYHYLIQQDYWLSQTSLYKYFNSSEEGGRIPLDYRFIIKFAEFLGLSREQTRALLQTWSIKRSRKSYQWEGALD